ncbi:hypothetical protein Hanom_Chr16g01462041 [Helianthus anomalus]
MAIVSDDEIMHEPEIFTSDTESDLEMLSDDDDNFQPFALPDLGDDAPIADGILVEDIFALPATIHDHLIIGHPDGEHIVALILVPVPLVVIRPEDWLIDDLFDDDVDLFLDCPPADAQGDGEVDNVVVLEEIPAPRPVEDTSGQPPSFNPFASADFPLIPQITTFTPFTSASLDELFRWFPPYTISISDPYHPSHYGGYTRDELLLSLQFQFEILSRRVLELEFGEGARRSPCPVIPLLSLLIHRQLHSYLQLLLPHLFPVLMPVFSLSSSRLAFLIRRIYELEEELAHVRSLLFFPPPLPSAPWVFGFMQMHYFW